MALWSGCRAMLRGRCVPTLPSTTNQTRRTCRRSAGSVAASLVIVPAMAPSSHVFASVVVSIWSMACGKDVLLVVFPVVWVVVGCVRVVLGGSSRGALAVGLVPIALRCGMMLLSARQPRFVLCALCGGALVASVCCCCVAG